jgi:diacylglycerol kinase family enzyme
MRAVVLLNLGAGTLARMPVASGAAAAQVRAALAAAGIDAEVREVDATELAAAARSAAGDEQVDAVIAGGGDGTVNTVASAIAGSGKALGVLPLGTLNHFARSLGMPSGLEQAAAALAGARTRAIDVGEVNGVLFVNNASIGLYPRVVGKREELRRHLGRNKFVATLLASLWVFRRFPTVRVSIHAPANGTKVHCETPFVFVGNNRYEVSLLVLGERPCLDLGELGVYFSKRSGRLAMLRIALRALLGRLKQARDFESMTLKELWIQTRRHHVRVAVDGEVRRLKPPLHLRSRPGELKVLAPPRFRASCRAEQSMESTVLS